jgi:hypothetical protein
VGTRPRNLAATFAPTTTRTKQRLGLFVNTVSTNCKVMHFLNSTPPVVGNRDTSFASNPFWLFEDFLYIPPPWLLGPWYAVL